MSFCAAPFQFQIYIDILFFPPTNCLTILIFCKCAADSLNESFSKWGLIVFLHPQGHLIINYLTFNEHDFWKLCFVLGFFFCCFFFFSPPSLMFRTVECNLTLYIGVIMEDGFIFGYVILYLIFSLIFVKSVMWEYMALFGHSVCGFLVGREGGEGVWWLFFCPALENSQPFLHDIKCYSHTGLIP